jgi:ABC-2 type transport system permease protein
MRAGEVQFIVVVPPVSSAICCAASGPRCSWRPTPPTRPPPATPSPRLATWRNGRWRTTCKARCARCSRHAAAVRVRVHRRYNPEGLSRYNIVPGLIGTILTMTMIMFTGLAMTRERERGTMENLLATPVRPAEVMVGKIAALRGDRLRAADGDLGAAWVLFAVPMVGSRPLLGAMIGVFIVANLAVGFTFSTLARNQLQAVQMTLFFFLPSMLLSGFMFPFAACRAGRSGSARCCR